MLWLFRRRRPSAPATSQVPPDWIETDAWVAWDAPRHYVAGEDGHAAVLTELTGPARDDGWCVPAAVTFVREADNEEDGNAFRAEIGEQPVGYLRPHIAAQLARPFDRKRIGTFAVCGIVRGGSLEDPDLAVHIWLDKTLTPGLELTLPDADLEWTVPWPPGDGERRAQ